MDGIFGKRFDLNNDGHMSVPEHMVDFAVFNHFMEEIDAEGAEEAAKSRRSSIDDDYFDSSGSFDDDYRAVLFADVDDMDDLDDEDNFDRDDDDFDDDYDEDDFDEDDYDDDFDDEVDDFDFDDDSDLYDDDI